MDGVERQAVPWPDWAITTAIDTRDVWPAVWRAVSCHESQIAAYERLKDLSPAHHQALWGAQSFYRVLSIVNGGRARETDLFAGIRGRCSAGLVAQGFRVLQHLPAVTARSAAAIVRGAEVGCAAKPLERSE